MLIQSVLSLLVLASVIRAQDTPNEPLTKCRNLRTNFADSSSGWIVHNPNVDTFEISEKDGIRMVLIPPQKYVRLMDNELDLPYNLQEASGPTFNSTYYMRYGRFSATVKSAPVGGAVTAMILMADGGDEIDYEILGGDPDHIQSNFFYGGKLEYVINGGNHLVPGNPIYDDFHVYTIDWSPERIVWEVNGKILRVQEKKETCGEGVCKYPTHPARVQLGLWDGSTKAGTAQWARGPIDWTEYSSISAYVKEVTIECNSKYNSIVDELGNVESASLAKGDSPIEEDKKDISSIQSSMASSIPSFLTMVGIASVSFTVYLLSGH
ncbi:concanavalin A-like lectin/glucanase domain-containing protein [Spinellus fusiger]|nr:concanavalin A-like lectin/glucanase domain-containing protein [Spinellus fusiger]